MVWQDWKNATVDANIHHYIHHLHIGESMLAFLLWTASAPTEWLIVLGWIKERKRRWRTWSLTPFSALPTFTMPTLVPRTMSNICHSTVFLFYWLVCCPLKGVVSCSQGANKVTPTPCHDCKYYKGSCISYFIKVYI